MKKIILLFCGFLCLALGALGTVIPIFPTTPFVLIAAGCFSATPALYGRIYRIKFFREYLDAYKEGKPVRLVVRIASITILWAALIISMITAKVMAMYIVLPVVGFAVTIHLLTIGRKKKVILPEAETAE
ncbi:MAG: YbaN family protein [Ruminococcus sp.]|jgi:uncharacterized membrane protein YbaN (DUF454 family)|nr:YbaN family protein [Ruminococcus sp.]